MRIALVCAFWLLAAAGALFGQQQTAFVPDEIFYNGKIITVDSAFSVQEAVLSRGTTAALDRRRKEPRSPIGND